MARLVGGLGDSRLAAALDALSEPLGARPVLESLGSGPASRGPSADPTLALVVESSRREGAPAALEIAPALAQALVDRTLGGEGRPGDLAALGEVGQGVLLWLASEVIGVAAPGWCIAGVVTRREALRALVGPAAPLAATLTLPGGARGSVHLHLGHDVPELTPTEEGLGAFARATVPARVDGGAATLTAAELARLRPGDVVLLDEALWPGDAAVLNVAGLRWALRHEDGRLRVHERLSSRPLAVAGRPAGADQERTMTTTTPGRRGTGDPPTSDDLPLTELDDAPVELSVELARFSMRLAEARQLRPGEVVGTGVRLGERVRLRAGEAVVAEGELVDIEGEVGVRILRLRE